MKKIVNGKRYDTETADLVASWGNGYYSTDFKHCEEGLYRTKKGNFFLFGEGGPMSKYAVGTGNGYSGGSNLAPMTPDEARQWLEDTGNFSELEKLFADSVEDA